MPLIQAGISARVRAQYEAFPYPHYPVFLPLRTQEAYASNSLFAARVLEQHGQMPAVRLAKDARVWLAGCGDVFPYLASFWEPLRHSLIATDLSARSLARARLRCLPRLRGIDWRQGNLEDVQCGFPGASHIDCYGVLHHLADPGAVLRRFAGALPPGGTVRIMVYNSRARDWIRQVQKAFAMLGLSAFARGDRGSGRRLLAMLADASPAFRARIAPMPGSTFANASRLVDTFFHAREARLDLGFWLRAIDAAGLRVIGVLDRHAELDDLPNPLLQAPEADAWRERIADRRFENNFEMYLAGAGVPESDVGNGPESLPPSACRLPSPQFLRTPPLAWFAYPETRSLPWLARRRIWMHFLARLRGRGAAPADAWAGRFAPETLQRLARIGALFPDDFRSREIRDLLLRPIHDAMDPPESFAPGPIFANREIRAEAERLLSEKSRPGRYLDLVMKRLDAAQAF